jgi:formylglycine-generating enzyme required for sulfatase activity
MFNPTNSGIAPFCLSNRAVSVGEFCEFLNVTSPRNLNGNEYLLFNPFHEYSPIVRTGGTWRVTESVDVNKPMKLVTLFGAMKFAAYHGVRLIALREWAVIRDGSHQHASAGHADFVKELGFDRLAAWALPEGALSRPEDLATQSYPVVGWAKGRSAARGGNVGVYHRWTRTGAVSVGIRCAWSSS